MLTQNRIPLLDHGYIELIESYGSDERIIEAARMSTGKGFLGWGPICAECGWTHPAGGDGDHEAGCSRPGTTKVGDEKLLGYLWNHKHATPFEMAGLIIEVQAPIFVFREWHRHRTQCLAPNTLVHFDAPKSGVYGRRSVYKLSMEDIYRKWQPSMRSSRPERQTNALYGRTRLQQMQLRVLDEERREVGHGRIVDVIKGDPKPMVTVTTASGRIITATLAHRFMTNEGWATLGDALSAGAKLTLEGTTRGIAQRWEVSSTPQYKREWRDVVGWPEYQVSSFGQVRRKNCDTKKSTINPQGYDVVSLNRPGEQATRTVHSLVLEAFEGPSEGRETRHLDSNRANNHIENLRWGSALENANDRTASDRQQRLVSVFEDVVSVTPAGDLTTYDLSVEGPWHNFVADGFVVHNSYNEMSARYTPLPDLNYVPTIERLLMVPGAENKQAGLAAGASRMSPLKAVEFRERLQTLYEAQQEFYDWALGIGAPKELARIDLPVGRYSRMRAAANLRNWIAFLTLRMDSAAQHEIRLYANALCEVLKERFPRTMELFCAG